MGRRGCKYAFRNTVADTHSHTHTQTHDILSQQMKQLVSLCFVSSWSLSKANTSLTAQTLHCSENIYEAMYYFVIIMAWNVCSLDVYYVCLMSCFPILFTLLEQTLVMVTLVLSLFLFHCTPARTSLFSCLWLFFPSLFNAHHAFYARTLICFDFLLSLCARQICKENYWASFKRAAWSKGF